MSLLQLALSYVWHRKLVSAFTILSVSLAVALLLVVINVRRDVERNMFRQTRSISLIAGAPGSETAIVMAALFHADQARGNITFRNYEQIASEPGVLAAYPFCLGDNYRGAPIVGTTKAFFDRKLADGKAILNVETGKMFEREFEIVAGFEAARRHKINIGDKIVGTHGAAGAKHDHDEHPYTVVGILERSGTPHDNALFGSMNSYWILHEDHDEDETPAPPNREREVTLVLMETSMPRLFQIREQLMKKFPIAVVRPAEVLERMFEQVLDPFEKILLAYGAAVALVAAVAIMTTLTLAMLVRRRDMAILRCIGALPREVLTIVLLEAVVLLTLGCGVGVLLSQLAGTAIRTHLEGKFGLSLAAFRFTPAELLVLAGVFVLGLFAALLPALQAYRQEATAVLASS